MSMKPVQIPTQPANRHQNQHGPKKRQGMRVIVLGWLVLMGAGAWQAGPLKAALEAPFEAATRARILNIEGRKLAAAQYIARTIATFRQGIHEYATPGYTAAHWELSRNVLLEAGIEPLEGKLAVACVTINRVKSRRFPNTVRSVIWQYAQFSWTHLPKYAPYRGPKARAAVIKTAARYPSWRVAWRGSKRAASQVLSGAYDCGRFAGIYHYMNPDHVSLRHRKQWRRGYGPAFRIGRHVFWKRRPAPVRHARNHRATR